MTLNRCSTEISSVADSRLGSHHRASRFSVGARASNWRYHSEAIKYFWAPPKFRKDHASEHGGVVHEHWLELFMDLILVAFLSNLSHTLVASGPNALNFFMTFQIYYLVLEKMHFISFMVNILVIRDTIITLLLFVVTAGIFLMASSLHTKEHLPCMSHVGTVKQYVALFYTGMIMTSVGELAMYAQLHCFISSFRLFTRIHIVEGICSLTMVILAVIVFPYETLPHSVSNTYYICIAMTNVARILSSLAAATYTKKYAAMDMSHIHSRLGMLAVVTLGEWVIQIIVVAHPHWQLFYSLMQLFICFGIAMLIFNTRPHGVGEVANQFQFILTMHLHYYLGFALFLAGTAIDLEELVAHLDVGNHESHSHSDHHCESTGWDDWSSKRFRSGAMGSSHILILIIRHFYKMNVMQQGVVPGLKFYARLFLAVLHFGVPRFQMWLSGLLSSLSSRTAFKNDFEACTGWHVILIVCSVMTDISLHSSNYWRNSEGAESFAFHGSVTGEEHRKQGNTRDSHNIELGASGSHPGDVISLMNGATPLPPQPAHP